MLKKSFVALESQITGFELSMLQLSGAVCGEMATDSHSSSPLWTVVMGSKKCALGHSLSLSQTTKKPRAWVAFKNGFKEWCVCVCVCATDRGFLPMQVGTGSWWRFEVPPFITMELGQGLAIHLKPQSGKVQLGVLPLSPMAKLPSVIK